MGKRKISEAEVEKLQKKFKALQEQIIQLKTAQQQNTDSEESEYEEDAQNDGESSGEGSVRESDQKTDEKEMSEARGEELQIEENKENIPTNKDEEKQSGEPPLDEETEMILGQDPLQSKAYDIKIHSSILKRWQYWISNGMDKDDKENLLERYKCPPGLEVLKLNPEISLKLPKHSKTRDAYMIKRQQAAGSALASIGWALSTLIEEKESIDRRFLLERLHDAGKMIADMINSQTKSRMAFILAGVDKETKSILEDTRPEEFLFGKNLSEKIKEAKSMDRVANTLKKYPSQKGQTGQKQNLNANSLPGKRPFSGPPGYSQGQAQFQHQRTRLFFRNRPQNQPFNQKASYQGQQGYKQRPQNKFK